jgi:hypothetical protein
MVSLATGLLLGFLLGIRHALEPDHLAAVSVLVTRRGSPGAGAALGALWGLGHSLALFVVGSVLAGMGSRLPPRLADTFELLVAAMLVTLGARAILRAGRGARAARDLPAGAGWTMARQPLLVGLIHGLAGSGALAALALAGLPTVTTRVLYIVLFGIGSVIGMAGLTGLAGWPLTRLDANGRLSRGLSTATGSFSLLLGAAWGWSAVRALIG